MSVIVTFGADRSRRRVSLDEAVYKIQVRVTLIIEVVTGEIRGV